MAEEKEIFQGKINDIEIDFENLSDEFSKAIVRHELPYSDDTILQDLGMKARTCRIRCYFLNDRYEEHKELLEALEDLEDIEFLHPVYGLLNGCIESLVVAHDDRKRTAQIDVTFVEGVDDIDDADDSTSDSVDVKQSTEQQFQDGQDEAQDAFSQDVREALGTEGDALLEKELDPTLPLLPQFTGLSTAARNYVRTIDTYVAGLNSTLAEITNPTTGLIAVIDYGYTLPGIVIYSTAAALERYAILYESLMSSPYRYLSSMYDAIVGLQEEYPLFAKTTLIAGAQRLGIELAYCLDEDETARRAVKKQAESRSFDALGNYTEPDEADSVMTLNELENSLALVRTIIDDAVSQERTMQSLKTTAELLQRHAIETLIERDKIVDIELDIEMPLHLVCLRYGLPYKYADRIKAINSIKNPSFTSPGEIKIYAR
jgi:prophage DNA circulation protein